MKVVKKVKPRTKLIEGRAVVELTPSEVAYIAATLGRVALPFHDLSLPLYRNFADIVSGLGVTGEEYNYYTRLEFSPPLDKENK